MRPERKLWSASLAFAVGSPDGWGVSESLVLTIIAVDKPGLIERLATVIAEHRGNWQASRMARLAGRFAGILEVSVASGKLADLRTALEALDGPELRVVVDGREAGHRGQVSERLYRLELTGHDRPGIVQMISGSLAALKVNVVELSTERKSVPMGGGDLFRASAEIELPADLETDALRARLESLAHDLMVDLDLVNVPEPE